MRCELHGTDGKTTENENRWAHKSYSMEYKHITDYRLQEGHKFDWKIVILDEEPQYRKRLVSEKLYIRKQTRDSICRRIGETSQGLFSDCWWAINVEVVELPVNVLSLYKIILFETFDLVFDFLSDYNDIKFFYTRNAPFNYN